MRNENILREQNVLIGLANLASEAVKSYDQLYIRQHTEEYNRGINSIIRHWGHDPMLTKSKMEFLFEYTRNLNNETDPVPLVVKQESDYLNVLTDNWFKLLLSKLGYEPNKFVTLSNFYASFKRSGYSISVMVVPPVAEDYPNYKELYEDDEFTLVRYTNNDGEKVRYCINTDNNCEAIIVYSDYLYDLKQPDNHDLYDAVALFFALSR